MCTSGRIDVSCLVWSWYGSVDETSGSLTNFAQTAASEASCTLTRKKKKQKIKNLTLARRHFFPNWGTSVTVSLLSCSLHAWRKVYVLILSRYRSQNTPKYLATMHSKVKLQISSEFGCQCHPVELAYEMVKTLRQRRAVDGFRLEFPQAATPKHLHDDRRERYEEIASLGACCASRRDSRGLGNRWVRYFQKLQSATVTRDPADPIMSRDPRQQDHCSGIHETPTWQVRRPSGLLVEVWRAGGPQLVNNLVSLIQRVFHERRLPLSRRGDLLVPLWKGSGDHALCNKSFRNLGERASLKDCHENLTEGGRKTHESMASTGAVCERH